MMPAVIHLSIRRTTLTAARNQTDPDVAAVVPLIRRTRLMKAMSLAGKFE
jgi:hypothetical protein